MPKIRSKHITLEDIRNSACADRNRHLFSESGIKVTKSGMKRSKYGNKKSKYGNKKTEVDGIEFDSAKEAGRYKELKLLQKAGAIGLLELQVPFELNEGGTHSYKYIADFVYLDARTGEKVVEDAKGCRTREYLKKRRLMRKILGIVIREI